MSDETTEQPRAFLGLEKRLEATEVKALETDSVPATAKEAFSPSKDNLQLLGPTGQPVGPAPTGKVYTAQRRPVNHHCICGHTEMIVPPCGIEGVMIWRCMCGKQYKMIFHGRGRAAGETIFVGAF